VSAASRDAEDERDRGFEARRGEHDALARLDREAGPLDRGGGVAGGVTSSGDPGPQATVIGSLQQQPPGLAVGDDVLVEPQLGAG
jgi:hypothetical protein